MKYRAIIHRVLSEPWAILPSKLAEICEFLAVRAANETVDPEKVAELTQAAKERAKQAEREIENIAVIPVLGTIYHRDTGMTEMSGITSTASLRKQMKAAMGDETVRAIVLDIDSPGGAVYGTAEVAQEIRKARQKKPVYASVNGMAASAAYYIASQASKVFMSPSSEVGSIGVILAHQDISKALENEGVKVTIIKAGKYKAEANPYEPLTDESREGLQEVANDFYELFTADVAKGRNTTVARVKKDYGEGRLLRAAKAIEVGMADGVKTLDAVIAEAMADTMLRERAQSIASISEFEDYLRDAGFSRSQAKAIAGHGFQALCQCDAGEDQSQCDADQPTQQQAEPVTDEPKVDTNADYLARLKASLI